MTTGFVRSSRARWLAALAVSGAAWLGSLAAISATADGPFARGGAAATQTRATIVGTIKDASGVIQTGVTVVITTPAGIDRRQTSGTDGTYTFGGLAPGDYRLRVDDSANRWAPWSQDKVTVAAGDRLTVDITLKPRVAPGERRGGISGTVIGPSGQPLAGITVSVKGPGGTRTATSAASGAYSLTDLAPGTYQVSVGARTDSLAYQGDAFPLVAGESHSAEVHLQPVPPPAPPQPPTSSQGSQAGAKNPKGQPASGPPSTWVTGGNADGCVTCHKGAQDPHPNGGQGLTCTDCHGGNGSATSKDAAHTAHPSNPDRWKSSANPAETYTLLNHENSAWIRFENPSDMRVAPAICGRCHADIVHNVQVGSMMNSAQVYSTALYNNGSVPVKDALFSENYTSVSVGVPGQPQIVRTVPTPSADDTRLHGILPFLLPLPRFEITQSGAAFFRPFERGGGPKSELGNPDREDVPGQPDVTLTNRGFGTQASVDPVALGAQKIRLNDPVLAFMGTNNAPGDYRNSGCASCHVIYANDRDPFNSGPYAKYGNKGYTASDDPTIPKDESGHPIKHEFTRAIPSSQCITCHVHNGNGFVNSYLGYMWWDEETDGEHLYPKQQHNPTQTEIDEAGRFNPEEAAARGLWTDKKFLETVSEMNPQLRQAQFSDYHGHGWMFSRVYSRDKKGNFLDANGGVIPFDDKDLFAKAVHLKDIHLEKGMQCVDCHFEQDAHGTGKVIGDRRAAIEIGCEDCHGTVKARATLTGSGPASTKRNLAATSRTTPWGVPQFQARGGRIIQHSMTVQDTQWDVTQVIDTITPGTPVYNEKSRLAKTIQTDGRTWGNGAAAANLLAHDDTRMTCYSCHSSWTTNCFGCHLAASVNTRKPMLHNEGDESQVYASYNPQVLRTDAYMLGVDGTIEGHKVTTVRSSSSVTFSVRDGTRGWAINQVPTISSAGYNGNAFNTFVPHTVRAKETKQCTDCHVSAAGDNNAWMASILMLGTNQVNFMGRYIYTALGSGGVAAIAVTERDEPEAVYGSHLHAIAYPSNYADHQRRGGALTDVVTHGGKANQVQMYGEYLLAASGSDGFQVFDIANVGNKDFAQRIVTAPFSNQGLHVKTPDATGIAVGSPAPLDPKRQQLPVNEETPVAPLFGYAFISDRQDGLVTVDITTLTDQVPTNNHLSRGATFNPNGALTGATAITVAGNYAYVSTPTGLGVVDISNPVQPTLVTKLGAPLNAPRHVAVQFRYAFVTDADGLKVVDVTAPTKPTVVAGATVPLKDAHGIYLSRTYAYIGGGSDGLVIVNIERPEHPTLDQAFNAGGSITDAQDVKVGMLATSLFAYVADGKQGFKVVQLITPDTVPGSAGYSPRPAPKLIAHVDTHSPVVGVSEGYRRDRAVDESGNQVAVFGRRGARPFNLSEIQSFFLRNGAVWTVRDTPPGPPVAPARTFESMLGALWALVGSSVVLIGLAFGSVKMSRG